MIVLGDWSSLAEGLPKMGVEVLTYSEREEFCDFGKLTIYGWRDRQGLPLRSVTHWTTYEVRQ